MNLENGGNVENIDFFSFKNVPPALKETWLNSITRVVDSGRFIGGPIVEEFENSWAQYLSVNHAIGVNNGFDAIKVALHVLGIGQGDFVAVPAHTFIATWLAVESVGATPIGIDCTESGLIDLNQLEMSGVEFSAVIPVHMHGQMVNMSRLMQWAKNKGVVVVEDCAQAHGAEYEGKKAGTWGDIGAFSFYPTKNLGAFGDAGAIVTDNTELALKLRSYINYGSSQGDKYTYNMRGINSRLDPIQAAVLLVNLENLDEWNIARIRIAERYKKGLIRTTIKILPFEKNSVYHHFIILSANRDAVIKELMDRGISTEVHYPRSASENFHKLNTSSNSITFKCAESLARQTLSLPISPWISEKEIDYIIQSLIDIEDLVTREV
jgi:dTDP-4-amino-4,6-dideoxygalactose transaminase